MSLVLGDDPAPGIRRLTFNLPEKRNPLTYDLKAALWEAVDAGLEDTAVRALILTGAGPAFSAGGDLDAMKKRDPALMDVNLELNHKIVRRIAQAPKPVVTAVNGAAIGAGFAFALNADCVVAASGTRFGAPFLRLGLVPDGGLAYFLTRRIGHARARQAILRAQTFTGAEALALGIADELADDDGLQDRAIQFLLQLHKLLHHLHQTLAVEYSLHAINPTLQRLRFICSLDTHRQGKHYPYCGIPVPGRHIISSRKRSLRDDSWPRSPHHDQRQSAALHRSSRFPADHPQCPAIRPVT